MASLSPAQQLLVRLLLVGYPLAVVCAFIVILNNTEDSGNNFAGRRHESHLHAAQYQRSDYGVRPYNFPLCNGS
jgi:hypothetical protein